VPFCLREPTLQVAPELPTERLAAIVGKAPPEPFQVLSCLLKLALAGGPGDRLLVDRGRSTTPFVFARGGRTGRRPGG
jgi:hypothetical protein